MLTAPFPINYNVDVHSVLLRLAKRHVNRNQSYSFPGILSAEVLKRLLREKLTELMPIWSLRYPEGTGARIRRDKNGRDHIVEPSGLERSYSTTKTKTTQSVSK